MCFINRKKLGRLLACLLALVLLGGCAGKADAPLSDEGSAAGSASETAEVAEKTAAIPEELLSYREMTYGEYREHVSQEAEFYHELRFVASTDTEGVEVVFKGVYDTEIEGATLEDDSKSIRLQGRLGSIVRGLPEEVTEEELVQALSERYGETLQVSYGEGAGTAYYVGDEYLQLLLDTDGDAVLDAALQVPVSDGEMISNDTVVWLSWEL
jgi:hypothetical protein